MPLACSQRACEACILQVKAFLARLVAASRPDAEADDSKALPAGEGEAADAARPGTLGKVPGLKSEL